MTTTNAKERGSVARIAAFLATAITWPARIVRMALAFLLAFCGTLQIQAQVALADDTPSKESVVLITLYQGDEKDNYVIREQGQEVTDDDQLFTPQIAERKGSLDFTIIATWYELIPAEDEEGEDSYDGPYTSDITSLMDWSVNDTKLASVNKSGRVTAEGTEDGKVTVKAELKESKENLLNPAVFPSGFKTSFELELLNQPEEEPDNPDPEPEDPDPEPKSYAFVTAVEILQDNGESFAADDKQLMLPGTEDATYEFCARVRAVLDSNNEDEVVEYRITPANGLAAQSDGKLPDLIWEAVDVDAGETEGTASVSDGVLSISAGVKARINCYSDAGKQLSEGETSYVSDSVIVDATGGTAPSDDEPHELTYDPNGGTGEMDPVNGSVAEPVTVAECGFEGPEGKEFAAWNTEADGSGESYGPGASLPLPADVVLFAQWAQPSGGEEHTLTYDKNGGSGSMDNAEIKTAEPVTIAECGYTPPEDLAFKSWNTEKDGSGKTYSPGARVTLEKDLTLYAQWGEPHGDKLSAEISYIPVPKGEWTTLTAKAYGTGDSTFGFMWEEVTDGAKNATPVEEDDNLKPSVQSMRVWTNDDTIGRKFRVEVVTDDEREAVSEPIEIVEGDGFAVLLSYNPVEYGTNALFSLTSTERDATFEWQVSKDNERSWETIKGVTGQSYAVATIEENLGNFYRVKATLANGEYKFSNSQQLVARVPDAAPGSDPSDGDPDGDKPERPKDDPDSDDPDDYVPHYPEDPMEYPDGEDIDSTPAVPSDADGTRQIQNSSTGKTGTMVPIDNVDVVNPKDATVVTREQQESQQPGARWRKLAVMPEPEDIQELLADNPFAPVGTPLAAGVFAAGGVESFVSFRRQTRPSAAKF